MTVGCVCIGVSILFYLLHEANIFFCCRLSCLLFDLLRNDLIFLAMNTGNSSQSLASQNSDLSGISDA